MRRHLIACYDLLFTSTHVYKCNSIVKVVGVFVLSTLQVCAHSCSSAYRLGLCQQYVFLLCTLQKLHIANIVLYHLIAVAFAAFFLFPSLSLLLWRLLVLFFWFVSYGNSQRSCSQSPREIYVPLASVTALLGHPSSTCGRTTLSSHHQWWLIGGTGTQNQCNVQVACVAGTGCLLFFTGRAYSRFLSSP